MQNTLEKRILELDDINKINPNFEVLKILNKQTASKAECIFFDYNKKSLYLITTNAFPQLVDKIIAKLDEK